MPSQPFLRQRAGRWAVHCEEVSDPSKMAGSFFRRLRDNGHVQIPADDLRNFASREGLVGNAVIPGSCRTLLDHQSIKMGGIEPVHRGPAVETFTHVSRNA